MKYEEFINSKTVKVKESGFDIDESLLNENLFDYQREIVKRSIKKGKYALFVDTGLGKSIMQMNFADAIYRTTGENSLILAPLVVVYQLEKEASKFGFSLNRIYGENNKVKSGINITNYENIDNVDTSMFNCVVLDESSILKNFTGKTKNKLVSLFASYKYKLCCTATPSPNDFMELGNHSEFLDVMPSNEMLMRYFINDTMNFGTYRIKGHSEKDYWEWVASWAECISSPADLGYDGSSHILPELEEKYIEVEYDDTEYLSGDSLFGFSETNATTISRNKRKTLDLRIEELKSILAKGEQHLIWVDTNLEADTIKKEIPDIVEVRGSDKDAVKAQRLMDFADGKIDWLVTKSSIAGMGMNFQNANNMTFLGLNYSYEKYYQAVRRMWRFGQTKKVKVNVIVADNEKGILKTLERKKRQHNEMKLRMTQAIKGIRSNNELTMKSEKSVNIPNFLKGGDVKSTDTSFISSEYAIYNNDTVEVAKMMNDEVFDFSIYSPPFSNLYIYSDSVYDMGNCINDEEFFTQYNFLIKEKFRTHKNETYSLVHCKDLPAYKGSDGFSGLVDFTGNIIESHIKNGFTYHGKYRVWKDPVIEMQRTKTHGLLHKNFMNRSEVVRQGMADYVLIFKKTKEIKHDIVEVKAEIGKEAESRCMALWSNECDTIIREDDDIAGAFDYGVFSYEYYTSHKEEVLGNIKTGRSFTIGFKEYRVVNKNGGNIGLIDNTLDVIKELDKKGFKFHSRCYLTNGTELITFRNWNGEVQDGLVKKPLDMGYIGTDTPDKDESNLRLHTIHVWQRYASPIWNDIDDMPNADKFSWFDISQTNVLNKKQARDDKDEKHICPLQIDLIKKSILIYTKEGDTVASFFGGIGSEPVTAIELNRKAYAVELKSGYFDIMKSNISDATRNKRNLFN